MKNAPVRPGDGSSDPSMGAGKIVELIEGEIIPRLLMAHRRTAPAAETFTPVTAVSDPLKDIAALADLALDQEAIVLIRYCNELILRGLSVEALLVDYLAPAARLLGEKWTDDEIDFVAVTMALWRLQEVVHFVAASKPGAGIAAETHRRALFAPVPGDQHSFGTIIIDECFRRKGWDTICVTNPREPELATLLSANWVDVIGLTVSCDSHIGELPRLIGVLRAASRNPHVGVMVGGRAFIDNPGLAIRAGADATASDARSAVSCAEHMLEDLESRLAAPI